MTRIIRAAILPLGLVWVAFTSVAAAESLPNAKPEEVGLSSERLGRLTQMLVLAGSRLAHFFSCTAELAGDAAAAATTRSESASKRRGIVYPLLAK
jgi:hypothetical protein